jgi:flagellar basal-body rod protein FlgG
MIRSIYTAVSGLITGEAKMSVINNNIANANTMGFKSEDIAVKKFDDVLMRNYDKVVGGKNVKNTIGSLSLGSEIDEVVTNYQQGNLKTTDEETDFAIRGRGYFTVLRDDGISERNFYSRDGHFHVNHNGYLVNNSGDKVIGKNIDTDTDEPIFVGSGKIKLDQMGHLRIDEVEKYRFKVVDFEDYNNVKKVGDNYFFSEKTKEADNYSLKQNSLEQSNVDISSEMVNMMTVMRNFESNQKVIQSLDQTLSKSVNELGSVR